MRDFQPAVTEISEKFFANLDGYTDDGSGTYTGVASALIERAPDILRHILATYAAETSVVTAVSTFGSFIDARAELKTWRSNDMKLALSMPQAVDITTILSVLASTSFCWLFLDRFTDKWTLRPWRTDRAVDYPWKLSREHLTDSLDVQATPDSDVSAGVRVNYGYDWFSDTYRFEASAGQGKSNSGYSWFSRRDANCTVIASESDRLDYNTGTVQAASLTPGSYTPMALAQHVANQLTVGGPYQVGYGFTIVSGYNDKLDFNDGAVKAATIAAGVYTGESLATAIAAALNALSSGWTCTFSRATLLFTISRAGSFGLTFDGGANSATNIGPTIGFQGSTAVSPAVGQFVREEQRFFIQRRGAANVDLLFATGTNVARSCSELLGFLPVDAAGGISSHTGDFPKTRGEDDLAIAAARWHPKRELNLEARSIYDTDTARELRNRLVDATAKARQTVTLTTDFAPDMERSRVFEFDADMDQVMPYPDPDSDGSWAGKRFVAVSVEQMLGPTSFATTITGVSLG